MYIEVQLNEIKELQQLRDGVRELCVALPSTSHLRQPLFHYLGKYLPVKAAASIFDTR